MGYPELLRVLGEEAAREAQDVRAAGERDAVRIVEQARAAAAAARSALVLRARAEAEAEARTARETLAAARDRDALGERRRLLGALREDVRARLVASSSPELDARLLAELLPEAGPGPLAIEVDPGHEEACAAALARLDPDAAARAMVHAAPSARGGVQLVCGRRVLDATLPARLERAWPDLEIELAAILFGAGEDER